MSEIISLSAVGFASIFLAAACRPEIPDESWSAPKLIVALSSADEDTRIRVAAILAKAPPQAAYWPLVRALGDPRWEVRHAATQSLARLGDRRAAVPLEHALHDRHWWVRAGAAQALGALGLQRSALSAAREDENDAVKQAASGALERIGMLRRSHALSD